MKSNIKLYRQPNAEPRNKKIVEGIIAITKSLVGKWFSDNMPDEAFHNLQFHNALCITKEKEVVSFLLYTFWDGKIYISLMATRLDLQGKGLGSQLIERFFSEAQKLGYQNVSVFTIPEDVNPKYSGTIHFYEKHGFKIIKRYTELWREAALLLEKKFS
jgi:ribosomal protein S18 acetylase RimI-like enzyme